MNDSKRKYNLLITGWDGFIGRNLCSIFSDKKKFNIIKFSGNIEDPIFYKGPKLNWIIHLAANTNTREKNPLATYKTNVYGFINILEFALKEKINFIYASSTAQYGNYEKTPYAKSKEMDDQIIMDLIPKTSVKLIGLRFVNVFGPGETSKGPMASVITKWAESISEGKRPQIFKEKKPYAKRDYVYVKDAVKAIEQAFSLPSGFYDVGYGTPVRFEWLFKKIQKILKKKVPPIWIENPYGAAYQKFTKADISWGFQPDFNLETAIEDYLTNYL